MWLRTVQHTLATRVEAVSVAIVDVVLTLRIREPPTRAYTAIGTMHV